MSLSRPSSVARASLTMLGTTIGAGVFAIPFAMKTLGGFAGSLIFWTIAAVILSAHLLYGYVLLHDVGLHGRRFPGHVKHILGSRAGYLSIFSYSFHILGACAAYILLGGEFLMKLFAFAHLPLGSVGWETVYWLGGAISVYFGLRVIQRIDSAMATCLIFLLGVAIACFITRADPTFFITSHWSEMFAPLGILVFSLNAFAVIPEVVEISGRGEDAYWAIGLGSVGAAVLIWAFGTLGAAAVGSALTADPGSIALAFPSMLWWLLPAVGFCSVSTSFITVTQDLASMIRFDLRQPKLFALSVALVIPFVLALTVRQNFSGIVSVVGGTFGSIDGMLIAVMALVFLKKQRRKLPHPITYIALACFAVFFVTFIWRILNLS